MRTPLFLRNGFHFGCNFEMFVGGIYAWESLLARRANLLEGLSSSTDFVRFIFLRDEWPGNRYGAGGGRIPTGPDFGAAEEKYKRAVAGGIPRGATLRDR
jgi:hypothetical protein